MPLNNMCAGMTKTQLIETLEKTVGRDDVVGLTTILQNIDYDHKKGFMVQGLFTKDMFPVDRELSAITKTNAIIIVFGEPKMLAPEVLQDVMDVRNQELEREREGQEIKVKFRVKLLQGPNKGDFVNLETDLEYLEEEDLSSLLLEQGHFPNGMGHPCDYYTVIERGVEIVKNQR